MYIFTILMMHLVIQMHSVAIRISNILATYSEHLFNFHCGSLMIIKLELILNAALGLLVFLPIESVPVGASL
jgi:hypothetical protein